MTNVSGVMDELRGLLGTMTAPVINEIERGAIRRYAEAVGDPNPLYTDIEFARKSRYGEVISPPGFFGWAMKVTTGAIEVMAPVFAALINGGLIRILDAGREYEFFLPVRAGDRLAWYAKFADVKEREGKSGLMVLITMEITYVNIHGNRVAVSRQTFIAR
ncbi:MAG: MaoC family dehydratase N-terminal domain-containing protein [Dehalococcoidia bacterium]|nr:MAG: MaoC family dehydratase N-terminal domain-containing protein [Dehalococcoidia bacterium]